MITRYVAEFDITYPEMTCDVAREHGYEPTYKSEPDTSTGECEKEAGARGWLVVAFAGGNSHLCPQCKREIIAAYARTWGDGKVTAQ